jgi:hypothetical protein
LPSGAGPCATPTRSRLVRTGACRCDECHGSSAPEPVLAGTSSSVMSAGHPSRSTR